MGVRLAFFARMRKVPSYQVFGIVADLDVIWKVKALLPVDNFTVDILPVVGAKRRPAHKTFEHDGSE